MPDQSPETITTVVTKRADSLDQSVTARTPWDQPDVRVIALPWWQILLIRAARAYLTTLTGLLSAGVSGADRGILPNDFGSLLWAASGMALAPAVMSILINGGELLAKLDEKIPQMRA